MKTEILQFLPVILHLTILQVVALISPGPDFAVVLRNSLIYSRRTALLTALGIATGIIVHIIYISLGIGFIIKDTPWLFTTFKFVGAGYLCYIGYKGIKAKKKESQLELVDKSNDISVWKAFSTGFFTNVLNPKAMLFFLSIFSVVMNPNSPIIIYYIFGIITFLTTLVWFSFVAICLTSKKFRNKFNSIIHIIERVTGTILILLGIKLIL